jgi:hypothetical protein
MYAFKLNKFRDMILQRTSCNVTSKHRQQPGTAVQFLGICIWMTVSFFFEQNLDDWI